MFIIVHVPKTAGTSFGQILKDHFGEQLKTIYGESPMNRSPVERHYWIVQLAQQELTIDYGRISCVFGHFLPYRYSLLKEVMPLTFITWMRHPIRRAVSEYFFIRRYKHLFLDKPFHAKLIQENWSLEQYLFCEEHRNYYDQYFWGFPLSSFSFIGIVEYFEADLAYFSKTYLHQSYDSIHLNEGDYNRSETLVAPALLKELEVYHQRDMDLYQQALDMRSQRLILKV